MPDETSHVDLNLIGIQIRLLMRYLVMMKSPLRIHGVSSWYFHQGCHFRHHLQWYLG